MNITKVLLFIACITVTLAVGGISGFATATSINNWYVYLQKPWFNPPNYLFGPVWTILYLLMGISFFMILTTLSTAKKRTSAVAVFGIQLTLNFAWSFIFFKYHQLGWALVEIIAMWISIFTMIIVFSRINKTAAIMQIPYISWVSFATILNLAIWRLN